MPWQPRPPGSCWQRGREALPHQGLGRQEAGAGPGEGGLRSRVRGWGPGLAGDVRAWEAPGHEGGITLGQAAGAAAQGGGQRDTGLGPEVRSQKGQSGHRGQQADPSPLRRAPSSSGFLVTDTTFMTSRFPPWRIRATTCLCPTFTTFTPLTWDRQAGGQGWSGCVLLGPRGQHHPGSGLTSSRKSPVRSPALQATPSTSTDSRYCSAGKAGVGVNSSIGVSAAGDEGRLASSPGQAVATQRPAASGGQLGHSDPGRGSERGCLGHEGLARNLSEAPHSPRQEEPPTPPQ